MLEKIQIKRGNKNTLPILSAGEPAFTLDTKELFIGDGTTNFPIVANHKNLIINSNFQVVFDTFDSTGNTITLLPGESKYIYGNYYLRNLSTSLGTIIVSRTFTDGFLSIVGINSSISLEYREKLPRYTNTTGDIIYCKPFNGKTLTLSYDISNNSTLLPSVKAGIESNLVSFPLENGTTRKAVTFSMSYNEAETFPMQKIVLFSLTTNFSFSITIGNIKLEEGSTSSNYSSNALYYDIFMLNRTYFSCSTITRAIQITTNLIKFSVPLIVPSYYNYDIKLIQESLVLANTTGATQTGYTVAKSYNDKKTSVDINCTKISHGMTDAYILTKQFLDLRPY